MRSALSILEFMSEADKQARRYFYITKAAREAICQGNTEKEVTSNDAGLSIFQALFRDINNLPRTNTANVDQRTNSASTLAETPNPNSSTTQVWSAEAALNQMQNQPAEGTGMGFTPPYEDEPIDFDTLWYTGMQDGEVSHEGYLPMYSAINY